MNQNQELFCLEMFPYAEKAIGNQHGWLIRWAIAKAGVECGWDLNNVLIKRANNCLGIKAGYFNHSIKTWNLFTGVPVIWVKANTGPEAGEQIPWRVFISLDRCFDELVRMWNDRTTYKLFRKKALNAFERTYTGNLPGHVALINESITTVNQVLKFHNFVDRRGRIIV